MTVAELMRVLAETLAYAHGRNVLHRDLKPANVLLDEQGEPVVTDFGLAKEVEREESLTVTGQMMGTPSYMPPEQADGRIDLIDRRSDVYALGATLYECLVGAPPFVGASTIRIVHQVLHRDPIPPRRRRPDLDVDLETICLKCLEKEPHKRYTTAQELTDEMRRYLRGEPIQSRPISRAARAWRWCKRKPVVAGLTATVAVSLVAGIAVSTYFAIMADIARGRADDRAIAAGIAQKRADREAAEATAEKQRADREAAERHIAATLRRRNSAENRIGVAYRPL